MHNGRANGGKALRALLAEFDAIYDRHDADYKEAKTARALFNILDGLGPLKRTTAHLYEALQQAREATPDEPLFIEQRDEAYTISRAISLLHDEVNLALNFQIAKNAEEQNAKADEALMAQNRLNLLAAFTFPLISIATIFGMNLTHGLEDRHVLIFWIVFVTGSAVGLGLKSWVLPRKKKPRS